MSHPSGTGFVLRSGGFVSWAIRLLTRSRVNHAGICLGDGQTVESEAAGAVSKGERVVSPEVTYGMNLMARIEVQAPGRGLLIAEEARKLLGTPYNFLDLVALAWAARKDPTGPPEKPNWWQRRVMDNDRLICSQLFDLAHANARVHLFTDGRLPGQVTPGDIQDLMANSDRTITVEE